MPETETILVSIEIGNITREWSGSSATPTIDEINSATITLKNAFTGSTLTNVEATCINITGLLYSNTSVGTHANNIVGLVATNFRLDRTSGTQSFAIIDPSVGTPFTQNNVITEKRKLSITSITGEDKTYDGTDTATISSVVFSGDYTGGSVSVDVTATFDSSSVGNEKTITATTITPSDDTNYTITTALSSVTTTADIFIRRLSAAITVNDKTYDGTNAAVISSVALTGTYDGDTVSVDISKSIAKFVRNEVSTSEGVIQDMLVFSYSLDLSDKTNYTITNEFTASTTAKILRKDVIMTSITANDKTYDGTTIANTEVNFSGIPDNGIIIEYTSIGSFTDKYVELIDPSINNILSNIDNKTVTLTSFCFKANKNYNILGSPIGLTTTAKILPKNIKIIKDYLIERSKTWDGTSSGIVDIDSSAFIFGDDITLSFTGTYVNIYGRTPNFYSKNDNVLKIDSSSTVSLLGSDITNYNILPIYTMYLYEGGHEICFYGSVKVETASGFKQIKNLKRGDLIVTNDGYQPLAKLTCSFIKNKNNRYVLIKKGALNKNIPLNDIVVTKHHPMSISILSEKNDKDYEYLHIYPKSLANNNISNISFVKPNFEEREFNLVFDKQYEINVEGLKFLSHHPNNWKNPLKDAECIDKNKRSKKIYSTRKGSNFLLVKAGDLLIKNNVNIQDDDGKKKFFRRLLKFNYKYK